MFNKNIEIINKYPCVVFKIENFLDQNFYNQIRESFPNYSDILAMQHQEYGHKDIKFSSRLENYTNINYMKTIDNVYLKKFHEMVIHDDFFKFFYKRFFLHYCLARKYDVVQLLRLLRPPLNIVNKNKYDNKLKFYNHVETSIQYSLIPNNNELTPHTDSESKLLSLMLYFPDSKLNNVNLEKKQKEYGTQFWTSKKRSMSTMHQIGKKKIIFEEESQRAFKTIFEANTLYGFVKNNRSWHSVEGIDISDNYIRRSININFNF